jgi:hypothetical protein
MAKAKNPLVTRTVKRDKDFTVITVGLRKTAKNKCEKCGKNIKGLMECPDCGKTLCKDCADWAVSYSYRKAKTLILCVECVSSYKIKEAQNG